MAPGVYRAILSGLLLSSPHLAGETVAGLELPDVAAVVNGRKITGAMLSKRIVQSRSMAPAQFDRMDVQEKKKAVARVLRAMVIEEVEVEEAAKRGIVVADEEVESRLQRVRAQFAREEDFKQSLAGGHITLESWKEEMKKRLTISKLEKQVAGSSYLEWAKHQKAQWMKELLAKAEIREWHP